MAEAVAQLAAALESLRPVPGGIGHNGPPLDDDGNPIPAAFEDELRGAARLIADEAAKDAPDAMAIGQAALGLSRLAEWLRPKLESSANELFKEFGKLGGKAAVGLSTVAYAALVPPINNAITATG